MATFGLLRCREICYLWELWRLETDALLRVCMKGMLEIEDGDFICGP